MSDQCYQPGDFDHLLDLPEDHEDLRHLHTCAACRAQLDQYRTFLDRDNIPDGADLDDANARLTDFLDREIGGGQATILPGPGAAGGPQRNLRRWSPVLVAACLVCVAIMVGNRDDGRMDYPSGVVRDMSVEAPALATREAATDDGFVLSWTGPETADAYQVVVLDASMVEIARFDADSTGEFRLTRADHDWLQAPVGPVFWRMVALHNGDEVARSTVRALEAGH